MGTARHGLLVLVLAALACSADHVERRREYARCDLTPASLDAVLRREAAKPPCGQRALSRVGWTEAEWAEARTVMRFPIGTSPLGLRCGEKIGTTPKALACRSRRGTEAASCSAAEPIASSVPFFTDRVLTWGPLSDRLSESGGDGLPGTPAPARTFDRQLRAASHRHDFCYQHGLGTFVRSRSDCDSDFLADALRICRMSERDAPGVYAGVTLGQCMAHAEAAWLAVWLGGRSAQRDNTHGTCEYEGGINPARDHVVTGRFHDRKSGSPRPGLAELRAIASDTLLVTQFALDSDGGMSRVDEHRYRIEDFSLPEPPGGACDPAHRRPGGRCALPGLGLAAADLLNIGPRTIKLDGTGEDRLVLIGIHGLRPGPGAHAGGAFALILPRPGEAEAALPGWLRTEDEQDAAAANNGALPEIWLASQIEVFSGEIRTGRFLPEVRDEQVLVAALEGEAGSRGRRGMWSGRWSSGEGQALHLRLIHWREHRGERRPVLHPFSYTCAPTRAGAARALPLSACWRSADDDQPELFRRFQYRPFVFRNSEQEPHGLRFLVRDKADSPPRVDAAASRWEPPAGAFTSPEGASTTRLPDFAPEPQDAELDVVSIGPPEVCRQWLSARTPGATVSSGWRGTCSAPPRRVPC